jgi:hypothetical protein
MTGSVVARLVSFVASGEAVHTVPDRTLVYAICGGLIAVGLVVGVWLVRRVEHTVHEVEEPFGVPGHLSHDPIERLRAVHHATVGHLDVRVEQVPGGFRGEASTMMTGVQVWTGATHRSLDVAVTEAEALIATLVARSAGSPS